MNIRQTNRIRVAIVSDIDSENPYGTFQRVYGVAAELSDLCDVSLVGVNCDGLDVGETFSLATRPVIPYLIRLSRLVRSIKPDVVYVHRNLPGFAIALLRSTGMITEGIEVAFDFHTSSVFEYSSLTEGEAFNLGSWLRIRKHKLIERYILTQKGMFIAVSTKLQSFLQSRYHPKAPIHVIPNGVPEVFFSTPRATVNPYPDHDERRRVFLVAPGNFLSNDRAFSLARDVSRILKARNSDVKIYVAGGCREVESDTNFEVMGFVDDIIPYIDFADLCLLPYPATAVCGGVRTKAVEFLARKKAVLTTEEGISGIDELMNGESIFVCSDEPESLANELVRISRMQDIRKATGERGYEIVRKKYSYTRIARELHKLFQNRITSRATQYYS